MLTKEKFNELKEKEKRNKIDKNKKILKKLKERNKQKCQ